MDKAKKFLELSDEESNIVSRLAIPAHRSGSGLSFYEDFALKGIRVDRVEPGLVICTFKVPPRLTDRSGRLANGAIANLVDEVGGALVHVEGLPMNVSVDMSISFMSTAKLNDELEISSKVLGKRGGYSGTIVLMRNKATGEVIAEGRHSLFGRVRASEAVSRIVVPAQRLGESSIYDVFSLRGIRVDRAEPGLVVCTLKVPPRLTDRAGNLAKGSIANLVDVVGASVAYIHGLPMNVSVDITVSYMSMAKLDDELEITSKMLGRRGGYSGAIVLLRNKATGEIIAEGRHSMFRPAAKL